MIKLCEHEIKGKTVASTENAIVSSEGMLRAGGGRRKDHKGARKGTHTPIKIRVCRCAYGSPVCLSFCSSK